MENKPNTFASMILDRIVDALLEFSPAMRRGEWVQVFVCTEKQDCVFVFYGLRATNPNHQIEMTDNEILG